MKKYLLIVTVLFLITPTFAQKKKSTKPATTSALAKLNNLSLQLIKNNLYLFIENKGAKKDTVFSKKLVEKQLPFDCKIKSFVTKGITLYSISWSENTLIESKDKKEDRIQIVTEIWNITTKTNVLSNIQTTTKITEILYLDRLKNASQTSEKMRREGFELSLALDGDVILKNKTQENKLSYNVTSNMYENAASNSASKTKKK